jgi:ssDNA-binding Zn-finger/Zn-ribbon topoisomerase 1
MLPNKRENAAGAHGHMGAPTCPRCAKPMVKREAKAPSGGKRYWGCPSFPACLGVKLY